MNFLHLFDTIAAVDADAEGRFDSRRAVFKHLLRGGQKVAAAAAPGLLGAMFNRAYAGEQGVRATVTDVLRFALRLERLELNFYDYALNYPGSTLSVSIRNNQGLRTILTDEQAHVAALEGVIGTANLPPADTYNFAKIYTDVFSNDQTFLAVAQALEDTGVRAYKGSLPDLRSVPEVVEFAANLHSIEARHASHIRRMRGEDAWITGTNTTIPTVAGGITGNTFYQAGNPAAAFPSEANASQGGLSGLYAGNNIAADRYSEAFDEPLDATTVLSTIAALFLA